VLLVWALKIKFKRPIHFLVVAAYDANFRVIFTQQLTALNKMCITSKSWH